MTSIWRRDHVKLSIEDLVVFVLGEQEVIVVIEANVSPPHGHMIRDSRFEIRNYPISNLGNRQSVIGNLESSISNFESPLTNPFIELGILCGRQEGRQEGRQQGEVELVLKQLRRSLGTLTASQEKSVSMLKLPQIEALGEALLEFNSNSDLDRWLRTLTNPRNL